MTTKQKTSAGLLLLAALLSASAVGLAQSTHKQYLPSVQFNPVTAQPTRNTSVTPTATARATATPTATPEPTATPLPGPACAAALNASAFEGSFSFAFSDAAGAVKVDRSTTGTLRFANPVSTTNQGVIKSVSWEAQFANLTSMVDDADNTARSYSGGAHTALSVGYVEIEAQTCTWSLVLRPKITQTETSSGGSASGPDQVFNLSIFGKPLSQTNHVVGNGAVDAYCNDQPPFALPTQYADLATNVADGPIRNNSACDLYKAQGGAGLRGKLTKTATLTMDLAPVP
jgi:hypothetical protein